MSRKLNFFPTFSIIIIICIITIFFTFSNASLLSDDSDEYYSLDDILLDSNTTSDTNITFPLSDHTGLSSFQVGLLFTEAPTDYENKESLYEYALWKALSDITGLNSTYLDLPASASSIYGTQRFLTVVVNLYYEETNSTVENTSYTLTIPKGSNIKSLFNRLENLKNIYTPGYAPLKASTLSEQTKSDTESDWKLVTTNSLDGYTITSTLGGVRYVSSACDGDCSTSELTDGHLGSKSGRTTVYLVVVICIIVGYVVVIVLFALFVLVMKLFEKHQAELRRKLEQEALLKNQAESAN